MKRKIAILLMTVGLIVVIASSFTLVPSVVDEVNYNQVRIDAELIEREVSVDGVPISNDESGHNLDWDQLRSINGDIKAWVTVQSTNIDYPVTQTYDNDYYVNRNFWHNLSFAGCPFLDYRSDANGRNAIVYGHNLSGVGTMFSQIHDAGNQYRFDAIGSVWWATPEFGKLECKPIAAMSVLSTYVPIQTFDWTPESELISLELDKIVKSHESQSDSDQENHEAFSVRENDGTDQQLEVSTEYEPTEDDRLIAKKSAETIKFREWLKNVCKDATARSGDMLEQIENADRIVTLVSCSSNFANQPWRTLLICVVQD